MAPLITVIAIKTTLAQSAVSILVGIDRYFPPEDVMLELFSKSDTPFPPTPLGQGTWYSVTIDGKVIKDVAWVYAAPITSPEIKGHFAFNKDKVTFEIPPVPAPGTDTTTYSSTGTNTSTNTSTSTNTQLFTNAITHTYTNISHNSNYNMMAPPQRSQMQL